MPGMRSRAQQCRECAAERSNVNIYKYKYKFKFKYKYIPLYPPYGAGGGPGRVWRRKKTKKVLYI